MANELTQLEKAFAHIFYLVLAADKVVDLNELSLGSKIMKLEKLDKQAIMREVDMLGSMSKREVFTEAVALLKSISKPEATRYIAYLNMIAESDGSLDKSELTLINEFPVSDFGITEQEVFTTQRKLRDNLEKIKT